MTICYLCGKKITEKTSQDHVVPKQFIKRQHPKTKGFDYAGTLPTHPECNNRFGSEKMCQKAIQLLSVIYNPQTHAILQSKRKQDIKVLVLNHNYLNNFDVADLKFFGMYDAKEFSLKDIDNPKYFSNKKQSNLIKQASNIAISVLVKSAAAILVARFGVSPKSSWKVLAIPNVGVLDGIDFDKFLGETKPFEIGIKLWIKQFENGDYFAIYKSQDILLWLVFSFSPDSQNIREVIEKFPEEDHLLFERSTLNELVNYDWSVNKY